jgi:hypothetical protein
MQVREQPKAAPYGWANFPLALAMPTGSMARSARPAYKRAFDAQPCPEGI